MYIKFGSIEPVAYLPLTPSPNITEMIRFSESLKLDVESSGQFKVLDSYRGHILYCSGNVTVYRTDPMIQGGQGMLCPPVAGAEEDAHVKTPDGIFKARLNYF